MEDTFNVTVPTLGMNPKMLALRRGGELQQKLRALFTEARATTLSAYPLGQLLIINLSMLYTRVSSSLYHSIPMKQLSLSVQMFAALLCSVLIEQKLH